MATLVPKTTRPFQGLILLVLLWLQELVLFVQASEKVYFDKYGHCHRGRPFELSDEDFTAVPVGGDFYHENLDCSLTFKAASGYGVCVTFHKFRIDDCSVSFLIYEAKKKTGQVWKELSCYSDQPSQMCTSERYVTLRVLKKDLNGNRGYKFELEIEQSSSVTDEGVVFASIGLVVGIIVGVFFFIIIIALVIFWCCRRNGAMATSGNQHTVEEEEPMEPSAPPMLEADGYQESSLHPAPLYPPLQDKAMMDLPPPYEQPPSYSTHDVRT